jgi:hypothetical protein
MPLEATAAPLVVWGGGTGGVAAALQAARCGTDTLLLTPGPWLGGMVSAAGVCCPDGNELTPWQTGLWGAFLRELQRQEPSGLDHNWVSCFGYRPATAEAILRRWCDSEPRLQWWPSVQLEAVERRGNRIEALRVLRGGEPVRISLELLIDGSDLGDTFPLADAAYRFGWEARERWREPSAPPQKDLDLDPFFSRQPVQSPTWVVMGQLGATPSAPLPNTPLAPPFEAASDAFGLERTITYGRLPEGLVMLNWPLHGNDWHHQLPQLFDPDPAIRTAVEREMQHHSLAFLAALQQASDGWLQPGRCFPEPGADALALSGASPLALMPYWREGRRLVGLDVVTELQLLPQGTGQATAALPTDGAGAISSVAVGNYANDHHYPGPDWPLAPKSCRWGGRWSGTPFCIPFGALVSAQIDNLLAADKGFSTSHMANGATRLQPLILNIGQAAGAAAALALGRGLPASQVPVRALQELLISDPIAPAAVVPLWDTPWHHPDWRARQRAVLDDPARLGCDGQLVGDVPTAGSAASVPTEPHEQCWSGHVIPDGQGGFTLELPSGDHWPLITLEPSLNGWLNRLDGATPASLIGCRNSAGPWLRVSRLAG